MNELGSIRWVPTAGQTLLSELGAQQRVAVMGDLNQPKGVPREGGVQEQKKRVRPEDTLDF